MTFAQGVNNHDKDEVMNDNTPVFLNVSLTLWVVAQLTTSLASLALDVAML